MHDLGLVDWVGEDLLTQVDRERRENGEAKRRRKLGTVELLWLMLAVALDSGHNSLHEILRLAQAELGNSWQISVAGFCKARKLFPLHYLERIHGRLVRQICPGPANGQEQWHGMTVKALDKTTLNLPETPQLFTKFGSHKGSRGLGPISAE